MRSSSRLAAQEAGFRLAAARRYGAQWSMSLPPQKPHMKQSMYNTVIGLALTSAMLTSLMWQPAAQAASGAREAFFRCRDAKGQTYFGDSMPAECMNLDTEVLSERGMVVRTIDGEESRVIKEQRKSADEAAKKAQQDAAMRDRMLVEAYLSVQEIESLRDQRLGLLDSQIRLDEQNLAALKDREQRLLTQVQRYRPYSAKPKASAVPDHINEEMVSVVKSGSVTNERIVAKQAEKQELQAKFASDIKRFKELKGIK